MSDQQTEVRVRRAPRFGAFMVVGGGVGLIATLIATSLFPVDPGVGFTALAAYFSIFGISAGVILGALVALLLDRRSSKKARVIAAEREAIDLPAETEPALAVELEPRSDATPES